jgi:hypothetical protein
LRLISCNASSPPFSRTAPGSSKSCPGCSPHPAGLADVAELLGKLEQSNLRADDLLFGRHGVLQCAEAGRFALERFLRRLGRVRRHLGASVERDQGRLCAVRSRAGQPSRRASGRVLHRLRAHEGQIRDQLPPGAEDRAVGRAAQGRTRMQTRSPRRPPIRSAVPAISGSAASIVCCVATPPSSPMPRRFWAASPPTWPSPIHRTR